MLERNFKGWKNPGKYERLKETFFEPKPQSVEFETPDKANAWFLASQNLPMSTSHPDYPALMMGNYILGGGSLKSRLADRIRQKDGLSYGVGSFMNAETLDETGSLGGYAFFAPENVGAVEKAFFEEIEKAIAEGFTAEELVAAKSGWSQGQQVGRAQDRSLASKLSSNLQLDRDMAWEADLEAKVQALTVEEVNRVFKKYIDPAKMVVIKAGDFAKSRAVKP